MKTQRARYYMTATLLAAILVTVVMLAAVEAQLQRQPQQTVYACITGTFVGASPQLTPGYYTVFLEGVPDELETIYFPKRYGKVYEHALFGEDNRFDLRQHEGRWVVTGVKNRNGDVHYWPWLDPEDE